jgi:hypothetical protein
MAVLNQQLFSALSRRFNGKVKVANQGQALTVANVDDPFAVGRERKTKQQIAQHGEQYRVCCPYCGDKRYRLYISYRWNTVDEQGKPFGKWLIHCFNENCQELSRFEDELRMYASGGVRLGESIIIESPETYQSFNEAPLPGTCVPIVDLDASHPAVKYIEARKFSVEELWNVWQVQFCISAPPPHGLASNRIVVPAFWQGKQVGWQARAITEGSTPKYFTMPGLPKGRMLFNGDRAKTYPVGVVVEGVFDAFRVGPCAVALLGKSMSCMQQGHCLEAWNGKTIIIVLDDDAQKDMQQIASNIRASSFNGLVNCVTLPKGEDPATMTREGLWELIYESVRSALSPAVAK